MMTKIQGHLEGEEGKKAEKKILQVSLDFGTLLCLCSWNETLSSGPDPPTVFPTGIYSQG